MMKPLGVYNAANLVTCLGVVSACLSVAASLHGALAWAVIGLIWAGVFDLLDGRVARRLTLTDFERKFGIYLDSLADIISFGVAPFALYLAFLGTSFWTLVIGLFYVLAALMRLAYFTANTDAEDYDAKHYMGLPVTYAALILGLGFYLWTFVAGNIFSIIASLLLLGLGIAFVTPFKMRKPAGLVYVIMPALALIFTVLWAQVAIGAGINMGFVLTILYLCLPLIISGALHMAIVRGNFLGFLASPINLRAFGAHKTWRGIVVILVTSVLGVWITKLSTPLWGPRISVDFLDQSTVILGLTLGLGYALAELPNSYLKRRLGIQPGKQSDRHAFWFTLLDQADSALGCALVYLMFLDISWLILPVLILFGAAVHIAINVLLYAFGLRAEPF